MMCVVGGGGRGWERQAELTPPMLSQVLPREECFNCRGQNGQVRRRQNVHTPDAAPEIHLGFPGQTGLGFSNLAFQGERKPLRTTVLL